MLPGRRAIFRAKTDEEAAWATERSQSGACSAKKPGTIPRCGRWPRSWAGASWRSTSQPAPGSCWCISAPAPRWPVSIAPNPVSWWRRGRILSSAPGGAMNRWRDGFSGSPAGTRAWCISAAPGHPCPPGTLSLPRRSISCRSGPISCTTSCPCIALPQRTCPVPSSFGRSGNTYRDPGWQC